ncbi:MAG: Gfo/Idh/MocA family oxidoreductase [Candidatus Latescibacteria bacterium]|jgi:predicted dehydrogenase|nr:Gfo/Idh/MocA family oxidoreductase [Candidatus Latescibacterota bacterium]
MSREAVGFGIVGCGVVADYHIGGILETEGANLVAIADVVEERAREVGEKHGVQWYTDYKEMLKSPEIDVVCITTPSGIRIPIATDAAAAGKHLIIEKPIDITLEKTDRIIEAAGNAGVHLMCIFQLRYGEAVGTVREAVQQGKLGKIVLGDAYIKWYRPQEYYDSAGWRGTWDMEGGGALMTQGIHTVDLLQWIMGPVKRVSGAMGSLVHDVEVEDTVVATVEYESGALGVIEATTASHPGMPAKLEFSGSKGTVVVEADQITSWDVEGEELEVGGGDTSDIAKAASDSKTFGTEGHKAQISEMVQLVREGGTPKVDGPEGRKAVELILAIYESARKGEAVELPLT